MKNFFKRNILSISCIAILVFTSCSNINDSKVDNNTQTDNTQVEKGQTAKSKKAELRLYASDARTILPEVPEAADFDNFALSGNMKNSSDTISCTWNSYKEMTAAKILLNIGIWDFTLTATKSGNTYAGIVNDKEIKSGKNSISFDLTLASYGTTGKGSISVTFSILEAVDGKLDKITARYEALDGTEIETKEFTPEIQDGKITATYSKNDVTTGSYRIIWRISKGEFQTAEFSEVVFVAPGLLSKKTIEIQNDELESLNKITYVGLDGVTLTESLPEWYTLNSGLGALPTPTRPHYTFDRWHLGSIDGIIVNDGWKPWVHNGDLTIYANWKPIKVSSITLNYSSLVMSEGETLKINPTVEPEDALDKTLTWTSSNTNYVTVEDGLITVLKPLASSVTITATANDESGKYAQMTISNPSGAFSNSSLKSYLSRCKDSLKFADDMLADVADSDLYKYIEEFTIPSGYTSIAQNTFDSCTALKKLVIPDSITSIGNSAFYGCGSLEEITIPFIGRSKSSSSNDGFGEIFGRDAYEGGVATKQNTYTYYIPASLKKVTVTGGNIYYSAFYGCSNLEEIILPNDITSIDGYAFYGCNALTEITIPATVTSIGSYAFSGCSALTEITIPNGVTSIGDYAFNNCIGLTTITIPNGVTSIGEYAFKNCSGLTTITILNGVETIGYYAFYGCSSLEEITIPFIGRSKSSSYDVFGAIFGTIEYEGGVATKQNTYTYYIPASLKKVTITGNELKYGAFYGCSGLTEIVLTDGMTSISGKAFYECVGLTKITLPNTITSIDDYAFYGCSGLTKITIPDSIETIGDYAFYGCSGLKEFAIPNAVTSIGDYAFYNCSGLKEIAISGNVTSINDYVFYGCSGLTKITIPDSITTVGNYAFYNCGGLTKIALSDNVTSIGNYAFYNCSGLTSFVIPKDITAISSYVFFGCIGLSEINIPDKITSIGHGAFSGCRFTAISIPDSVVFIGNNAFNGCSRLTSITIPDSVISIGLYAFGKCSGLTEITIPFVGTSKNATTASANTLFGIVFGTTAYEGGVETKQNYAVNGSATYYIPSSLKKVTVTGGNIYYGAFYGCSGLTEIILPNTMTSIGDSAFYGCSGLIEMAIPDSVTSIGKSAFEECRNMSRIKLSNNITKLSYRILSNCSSLTEITIPEKVSTIGEIAFYKCTGLTNVVIPDSVTFIDFGVFSGCTGLVELTIPFVGESRDVKAEQSFSLFGRIFGTEKYEGGISCRQYYYVSSTQGSTEYRIPASLKKVTVTGKKVCWGAFRNCSMLEEIILPDGLEGIDSSTFMGCSGLKKITIPNSVKIIGSNSFTGCSSLEEITIPFIGMSKESTNEKALFGYIFGVGSGATQYYNDSGSSINYAVPASLKKVNITDMSELCYGAFSGCNNISEITLSNGLDEIKDYTFYECNNLKNLNVNLNSLTSIGKYAFYNCRSLTRISIPTSVTAINDYTFYGCKDLEITIPNTITSIGAYAFFNCACLSEIEFSDTIESIGNYAFSGCSMLSNITIPNGTIGDGAFSGCYGISDLTISDGVTFIGSYAFKDCNRLSSITIPNSVTEMGEGFLSGCSGLTEITSPFMGANRESDIMHLGYMFGADSYVGATAREQSYSVPNSSAIKSKTYYIPNLLTKVIITDSPCIGKGAFQNCPNLTEIILTEGVTSISTRAFAGCKGLTEIIIPSTVKLISSCAFEDCTGLTDIVVPDGATTIGSYAFMKCSALKTIVIPESVIYISYGAFSDCSNLTSIRIPANVRKIEYEAFVRCYSLASVTLPEGLTEISESAFGACRSLTQITIPSTVKTIGSKAFGGADLREVVIPSSVNLICPYAFSCENLTSVTFENTSGWYSGKTEDSVSFHDVRIPERNADVMKKGGTAVDRYFKHN